MSAARDPWLAANLSWTFSSLGQIYAGRRRAVSIPPDQYLTFGDNVSNSHDSRAWVKRTIVLKDGRKIVCESQQVMDLYSGFTRRLQEKLKQSELRYAIDGDIEGNEVAIPEAQFDHEEPPEAFRFVDRKFFVGRVLKIWWPLGRQRPVR